MVKIIKPDIVSHFDKKDCRHSIYSLDIQPTSQGSQIYGKLATAGGDFSVKIWDLNVIFSSADEDKLKDSILCTLEVHTKAVNIVRWSIDGQFLASGSDDNYVLVYKLTNDYLSSQPFGSQRVQNKVSLLLFI